MRFALACMRCPRLMREIEMNFSLIQIEWRLDTHTYLANTLDYCCQLGDTLDAAHRNGVAQVNRVHPTNNIHPVLAHEIRINFFFFFNFPFPFSDRLVHSLKCIKQVAQQLHAVVDGKNWPLAFFLAPKQISLRSGHGCFSRKAWDNHRVNL